MGVKISEVKTEEELSLVAELAEKIWHECFIGIISEEQIDYMVEKFQSYNAMKDQVASQDYHYFAVRDDDDICRYIAVKPEKDERFFLSKLYLRKDKRGKGIASKMLERVFEEAKNSGKSKVYLTVNKHNDHAVKVYEKTGFQTVECVVTDIGNGFVMDDFVMEYKL